MEPITADEIRELLKDALKQFGEYSFSDKGANEVMDVPAIIERLGEMPPDAVIAVLEDVYRTKRKPAFHQQLVMDLVSSMDGVADDRWEALMTSKILESCY